MSLESKRHRFTVDDYHRMAEVGILAPSERVELIDGQILEMAPIGARHARCVMFLNELFVRRLEGRALLSPQNPLRLSRWSEPEPDLVLLRPPLERYADAIPAPGDALLVVEVAETSQHRDRVVKLPRYAAAGLPEVWIVDLPGDVVELYRGPVDQAYRHVRRAARGESIAPGDFLDVAINVSDILG
jgi:Uma2 family endonuclease